jgi:hypothetical protein
MFVAHYGVGLGLKRADPGINLGALFVAVQLVDIAWAVLVLAGVERVAIVPGITPANPLDFVYYPFTHSLLASFGWAALAFLAARVTIGGNRTSLVMAVAVLSHFVLDLMAHRPDLPLAASDGAKIGLGLWYYPVASVLVESAIVIAGIRLYQRIHRARTGVVVFGWALIVFGVVSQFAPPPPNARVVAVTGLAIYVTVAAIGWWLDRSGASSRPARGDLK